MSSSSLISPWAARAATRGRRWRPGRRPALALAILAGAAAVLGPTRHASAFLFDVVFDPLALVEHVQQVLQVVAQVQQATQAVRCSVLELEHLGASSAPDVATTFATLTKQFEADVYAPPNPAEQLGQQYPTDMSNVTQSQYAAAQADWVAAERSSLAENRQVQNAVEQNLAGTTDRVAQIVSASNGAAGETAAAQANIDLLAVASGELAKLQALRVARSHLRADDLAAQQSEQAYGDAQRADVRDGWDAPAQPSSSLAPAFGE